MSASSASRRSIAGPRGLRSEPSVVPPADYAARHIAVMQERQARRQHTHLCRVHRHVAACLVTKPSRWPIGVRSSIPLRDEDQTGAVGWNVGESVRSRFPLRTREESLPADCGEHRLGDRRNTQVRGVHREVLDCGCVQDGVQFPGPGKMPLQHFALSLMSLGESGPDQRQVHAKPAHRQWNTERVLVAVAFDPGLDDARQNDPDCPASR